MNFSLQIKVRSKFFCFERGFSFIESRPKKPHVVTFYLLKLSISFYCHFNRIFSIILKISWTNIVEERIKVWPETFSFQFSSLKFREKLPSQLPWACKWPSTSCPASTVISSESAVKESSKIQQNVTFWVFDFEMAENVWIQSINQFGHGEQTGRGNTTQGEYNPNGI